MKKLDKTQEQKSYNLVKTITKAWEKTQNAFEQPLLAQAVKLDAIFKEQIVLNKIEDVVQEEENAAANSSDLNTS